MKGADRQNDYVWGAKQRRNENGAQSSRLWLSAQASEISSVSGEVWWRNLYRSSVLADLVNFLFVLERSMTLRTSMHCKNSNYWMLIMEHFCGHGNIFVVSVE